MSYDTIDALRESLARPAHQVQTPEYVAKMMHDVPETTVVDRAKFILERCAGKRVLEFGASGALHTLIRAQASEYLGVDRHGGDRVRAFDLDDVSFPGLPCPGVTISGEDGVGLGTFHPSMPEVIVCGEVLEHLANPGYFLERLRAQFADIPVIISVPNAFTEVGLKHIRDGVENVNRDHVSWYSYRTLRTLLERVGYTIDQFHWYNGQPFTAEGLIVVTK